MNENCNHTLTNGDDRHSDNENSDATRSEDDSLLVEVREHVEAMIEGFLGKSLDSAHVDMPYDHTQYNELFAKYKEKLMLAILDLTQTLYLTMQNKPTINSPTNAHVMLKELITKITEETNRLPLMLKVNSNNSDNEDNSHHISGYEELLATAILNQLVDANQMRHNKYSDDSSTITSDCESLNSRQFSDVGVQYDSIDTDSVMSCDPNTIIITSNHNKSINSDERNLLFTDFINQPPAYVVEEQYEEITTTKSYSGAEEDSLNDEYVNPEVNVKHSPVKVPFPEAGIDIVDVSDDELNGDQSVKLTDVQVWEENWLFKNNKRLNHGSDILYGYYYLNMLQFPVSMLIPNPGDNLLNDTDVNDLSDFSEHNSVCSLEFSSDEENELENENGANNESVQQLLILNKTPQKSKQIIAQKKVIPQKIKPNVKQIVVKVPQYLPIELRSTGQSNNDPKFVLKPGDASVQCGILVQFCCQANGTKPLQFAWFKQNSLLLSDCHNNIRIFQSGEQNILEIKKTSVANSGTYSCVVYNTNGHEWCDFTLKVRESTILSNITKRGRKQIDDSNKHEKKGDLYKAEHVKTIPIVIQRTWHQRVSDLENNNNSNFIGQDFEVMPAKRGKNDNINAKSKTNVYDPTVKLGDVSEREHKKWETAVEWNNNPYSAEKLSSRLRENSLSESNDMDVESPVSDKNAREVIYSLALNPNQKDLSRYKKDFYVANECNKEESLLSLDENEYSNSKYVDTNHKNKTIIEENKAIIEKRKSSVSSVNSRSNSIPKIDICDYETRSRSSSIESSLPSVKELVNKFSANKTTQNNDLKSSDDNLPKNNSDRVSTTLSLPNYKVKAGSLTGRSISREFREKLSHKPQPTNRTSINANNLILPLVRQESDTSSQSTNCSLTNEGYVSDDSITSSVASNVENVVLPIQQTNSNNNKNGNKVSRSVLKRASFWEKRCEQGLISDSSVSDNFPPIDATLND